MEHRTRGMAVTREELRAYCVSLAYLMRASFWESEERLLRNAAACLEESAVLLGTTPRSPRTVPVSAESP
jgi:hypothetical protein